MDIILKNGLVYDPANGIDGEVMDLSISNGKIVEKVDEKRAHVIDVSGKTVLPGGVDIHSHIAGPKVNLLRMVRPEDHVKDPDPKTGIKRSGTGHSLPSTFTTGYRYAVMGYTTVFEPANPPMKMLHVHDELNDTPILDKATYLLCGNNWFVMQYLKENKIDECAAYIAWLMEAVKGYAIKIVDAGSVEAWKWGHGVMDLGQQVPNFGVTPRDIIRGLCKVSKMLGLPHPIHVHANRLGYPGNYRTTVETMEAVREFAEEGRPVMHLAHAQFNSYGGMDWPSMKSGAEEVAKYVNGNSHVSLDIGQVVFAETTTMTADGPFEWDLHQITKNKWVNADLEVETGCGGVPIHYKKRNSVHGVMWATGLELALLVKDTNKICLTTDHPNGGPFTSYPRVMSWLLSKKARDRVLRKISRRSKARSSIESLDREYTLLELATVTRSAPATILGLNDKGHLGVGADADLAVYDFDPRKIDLSNQYRDVRKALRKTALTIKDGEVVVKDSEIVSVPMGRTYWVKPKISQDIKQMVVSRLEQEFDEYYTVKMKNYEIPDTYLARSTPVPV